MPIRPQIPGAYVSREHLKLPLARTGDETRSKGITDSPASGELGRTTDRLDGFHSSVSQYPQDTLRDMRTAALEKAEKSDKAADKWLGRTQAFFGLAVVAVGKVIGSTRRLMKAKKNVQKLDQRGESLAKREPGAEQKVELPLSKDGVGALGIGGFGIINGGGPRDGTNLPELRLSEPPYLAAATAGGIGGFFTGYASSSYSALSLGSGTASRAPQILR